MTLRYKDVFEAIHARLNAETLLRSSRTLTLWIEEERACVLREVNRLRATQRLPPVLLADVERAECCALGHSDYIRKYAYAAADLVCVEKPWAR